MLTTHVLSDLKYYHNSLNDLNLTTVPIADMQFLGG